LSNAYESYLESTILAADPLELVAMLYRGAQEAVRRARQAVDRGDIRGRAGEITKASEILTELALSLDHSHGGDISRNLTELYDYMQRRLIESNTQQRAEPLFEVERLLTTLMEGWNECRESLRPKTAVPSPRYPQPIYGEGVEKYSSLSLTA
jgi:flagellar protein FliS